MDRRRLVPLLIASALAVAAQLDPLPSEPLQEATEPVGDVVSEVEGAVTDTVVDDSDTVDSVEEAASEVVETVDEVVETVDGVVETASDLLDGDDDPGGDDPTASDSGGDGGGEGARGTMPTPSPPPTSGPAPAPADERPAADPVEVPSLDGERGGRGEAAGPAGPDSSGGLDVTLGGGAGAEPTPEVAGPSDDPGSSPARRPLTLLAGALLAMAVAGHAGVRAMAGGRHRR